MLRAFGDKVAFIWSVADLLRGDYRQSDYGKVILPFTVLRRLDCALAPTRAAVLKAEPRSRGELRGPMLERAARQRFYNTSKLSLDAVRRQSRSDVADALRSYVAEFSPNVAETFERFRFGDQITHLDSRDLLYEVVSRFCSIDLGPEAVSNTEMGYMFEELIRRFSEQSNETAGEHFTPREVIRLMVDVLFAADGDLLSRLGVERTLYDCACGTGGMLAVAEEHLRDMNAGARLTVFGQELNGESHAICRSDMLLKGHDPSNIVFGNSFSEDGHPDRRFDYMLANPPFGVEWKKVERAVKDEAASEGFNGRFGAGLPRINDGSFLFLQHLISKMRDPADGGSRIGIVFNGSPMFTGGAGSGESEIRRWIIENDWLECVIALPDQLFYNTGISTYLWFVTNRKSPERQGLVQLIDARELWTKMRRSLGDKRKELSAEQIAEITSIYDEFAEGDRCKILPNHAFGFWRVTIERPLVDEAGEVVRDGKGRPKPDAARRDAESVPLSGPVSVYEADPAAAVRAFATYESDVAAYVEREVLPWVSAAWADHAKTKPSYEIPLTRLFYKYTPPRPLEEIDAALKQAEAEIVELLREVTV